LNVAIFCVESLDKLSVNCLCHKGVCRTALTVTYTHTVTAVLRTPFYICVSQYLMHTLLNIHSAHDVSILVLVKCFKHFS